MFVNNEPRPDNTKRVYILGEDDDRRNAERAVKEGLVLLPNQPSMRSARTTRPPWPTPALCDSCEDQDGSGE